MDIEKLLQIVMESDDIKGVPVLYVFIVINSVLEAISSGECFYKAEID